MILLEKDHDAVFERNALGLLRLEFFQGRDGDLLPGLFLLGGCGESGERDQEGEREQEKPPHGGECPD
jgi:hypothetical protein